MPPLPRPPFALEPFAEGAVLLHLGTGACFRLNPTAADICRALLQGHSIDAIAQSLAKRFAIDVDRAASDVRATLSALDEPPPRKPIDEPLRYEATSEAHFVHVREAPVLLVDPSRALVRLASTSATQPDVSDAIDGVVPKLLALRGMLALHASAVANHGEVRAFSGPSGAGKTTTARAFVNVGCALVSEDVLVLRLDGENALAVLDAESRTRAWAERAKARLASDPASSVDFACLDLLADGPALPLSSALFLDASRRRGEAIGLEPLDGPDALMALFANAFVASTAPEDWRAVLSKLARVATATRAYVATMPDGVEALRTAIRNGFPDR